MNRHLWHTTPIQGKSVRLKSPTLGRLVGLVIYSDTDSLLLKLQNENVLLFLMDAQDLGHDFALYIFEEKKKQ